MKRLLRVATLMLLIIFTGAAAMAAQGAALEWSELPELPPAPGQSSQIGLAGPYAGVHNDALLVAGGANFPDALPWFGGKKVWWDDIYVLVKAEDGGYEWITDPSFKLPLPIAYGASFSTPEGVVCAGGCDGQKCYRDVFLLKWDPESRKVEIDKLPSMPEPMGFMAFAGKDGVLYITGGQKTMKDAAATDKFWALDMKKKGGPGFDWEELPPVPGPGRILPVTAAQSTGAGDALFVFGGRTFGPGVDVKPLVDGYKYNFSNGEWSILDDVEIDENPRCFMSGTGIDSGANHILVFGGDDGVLFMELAGYEKKIKEATAAGDTKTAEEFRAKLIETQGAHPGFSRDILAYHTITNTWAKVGELPEGSHVTTAAIHWGDSIVIPTGEIRPGVRTPVILKGDAPAANEFGLVNYIVLGGYLAALVGMGFYFSKREKSTDDFFKAGGRIPWWAAGLSIFGTSLSAITFMAIPAKTFATDWRYFFMNMAQLLAAPVVIALFLPFYRRLKVTTAYEYLELRFNAATRMLGSAMFLLFQFGRIGVVLFLPSIALSVVTGIDIKLCIVVMGLLSIAYTVLGGIEAVIWTDVLQVIVLMGGALLSLVIIIMNIDGGFGEMMKIAAADNKMHTFDFTLSLMEPTLWVVIIGGFAANLISAGSDQAFVQRYLTTKDEKSAARGIWTSALMVVPASLLFFGVGTALFVFFKTHPAMMSPTMGNADAIFPWYIVTQLPNGVAGLLIAGLFAAAMSSLDSSMNSAATAVTTDFFRRFKPRATDHNCLNFARWTTVVVGLAGTAFALMMAQWEIKSLWDEFSKVLGLLAGGLGGLFLLGIISRRANGTGAIIGLLGSAVVQYFVRQYEPVHLLLFTFTGVVSCLVIGFLASLVFKSDRPTTGLTIYTIDEVDKALEPDKPTEPEPIL